MEIEQVEDDKFILECDRSEVDTFWVGLFLVMKRRNKRDGTERKNYRKLGKALEGKARV